VSISEKVLKKVSTFLTPFQASSTKILYMPFLYKSALHSFSQFGFVIIWQKKIGAKAAHKMLMKLTTGQLRVEIRTLWHSLLK